MKVKVNLSNQTLEYMDSQPYIQGTDTRNVLNVYIEHSSVPQTEGAFNIMIAYALQNGRTTIKMANTGATQETIDDVLYDIFYFTAPKVLTSISGNFVATLILKVNSNTYKVNVLNTVLNAVDFEAFEDALDDTASEVLESLENMAEDITYLQSQVVGVLHNTDIVDNDDSNDPTKVLSARMGKVLAERIGATTSGLVSATYNESTGVLTLTYENDDTYEMKIGLSTTDKSNMADDVENVILADLFETFSTVKSYSTGDFVNYENNIYEFVSDKTSGAWDSTKVVVANLNDYIEEVNTSLANMTETIEGLGNLQPSGTDTSTNILAFNEDKGIYIGTDTGHWFYWNGTQYVDGGVYQATEIPDNSITINKFVDNLKNNFTTNGIVKVNNTTNEINTYTGNATNGIWFTDEKYHSGYITSIDFYASTGGNSIKIFLVDYENNEVIYTDSISSSVGINTFVINKIFTKDFYVGIIGTGIAFGTKTLVKQYVMSSSDDNYNLVLGDIITPVWVYQNPTPQVSFTLAFRVNYKGLDNSKSNLYNQLPDNSNNMKSIIKFSRFTKISNTNANWWGNNFEYEKGYIKEIRVKITTNNDNQRVAIVRKDNYEMLDMFRIDNYESTDEYTTIVVNKYYDYDFYVLVYGGGFDYYAIASGNGEYGFTTFNGYYRKGMIMPLSFNDPSSEMTFYIAIQIVYNTDLDKVNKDISNQTTSNNHNLKSGLTHNSMFVVGDSITAGHPYESEVGIHWWEILSRNYGFNITFGARNGSGYVYQSAGRNAIDLTANVDWKLYDQVIFNFGTNDYGQDKPIGTVNDMYDGGGDYTNLTVCGSVNYLINRVLTNNPSCNLIFVLPLNRNVGTFANNYAFGTPNNISKTLNDYCDAIIGCCNKYGIQYIDRRNSVVNAYTIQGGQLLVDGLHPSKNGYKIIGSELSARIGALIKPYIEYNPNDNDVYYGIESLN